MKKTLVIFGSVLLCALIISGCRKSVEVTAPWNTMNLPIRENAVVTQSDDKILGVTHKGTIKEIMPKYVEALQAQGWAKSVDDGKEENYRVMEKGDMQITIWGTDWKDGQINVAVDINKINRGGK